MQRTRGGAPTPEDRPTPTIEWIRPLGTPADAAPTSGSIGPGVNRQPSPGTRTDRAAATGDPSVRMHFVREGRPLPLLALWAVTGVVGLFVALALAQSRPAEQTALPVPPAPVPAATTPVPSVVAGTPQAPRRPQGHATARGSDDGRRRDGHPGARVTTTALAPAPSGAATDPDGGAGGSIDEVRGPRPAAT